MAELKRYISSGLSVIPCSICMSESKGNAMLTSSLHIAHGAIFNQIDVQGRLVVPLAGYGGPSRRPRRLGWLLHSRPRRQKNRRHGVALTSSIAVYIGNAAMGLP